MTKTIIKTLPLGLSLLGLVACGTPSVLVKTDKQFPSRPADSVLVFHDDYQSPAKALAYGTVEVKANDVPSGRCQYEQVLSLARNAVAQTGGNGLEISSKSLNKRNNTCRRLRGIMLHMDSTTYQAGVGILSSSIFSNNSSTPLGLQLSRLKSDARQSFSFKLNGGKSLITSEVIGAGSRYQQGWDVMLETFWQPNNGGGIGVTLKGNVSYVGGDIVYLCYMGPTFIYSVHYSDNWRADLALGIGATYVDEYFLGGMKSWGVGLMTKVGVEYMFGKHFGWGLELNDFWHAFPSSAEKWGKRSGLYGYNTIGFSMGPRFHF